VINTETKYAAYASVIATSSFPKVFMAYGTRKRSDLSSYLFFVENAALIKYSGVELSYARPSVA
jgi:hypothetical protein